MTNLSSINLTSGIIGVNKPRIDAAEKVTGSAVFADDIQFGNNLLHARVKRSPYPHAVIKSVDISGACELPGVKAVITGDDYPGYIGLYLKDRHILCRDRVRYVGDPVTAVAATSLEIAEQAVELIKVEYELLEPVLDPEFGVSDQAPLVHPELSTYEVASFILPRHGTNISNYFRIRKGDPEKVWGECKAVISRKYRIPHIQHVPIEPHVAIAKVEGNGKITLWGSSQSPFAQRNLIAQTLGISQSDIRVVAPYVGGGFGSKAGVSMESIAVALALKTKGRPVKLLLTREEEFYTAFVRQGLVAYFKIGCAENGKLLAMENRFYWDGGAYTEYDQFGMHLMSYEGMFIPSDDVRIKTVKEQIRRGNIEHILISQDVCFKICLTKWGGHGYAHILENIVPRFLQEGLTEEQVHTILVENPKRFLSW